MNKFLLFTVLLLLFSGLCSAQDDMDKLEYFDKKISLGFNFGNGFPILDYGSASASKMPLGKFTGQDTNRLNAYAKTGFHYEVYASYELFRPVSIMLEVAGDKNSCDMNTLNVQYASYFPQNTVSIYVSPEYYSTQFLAGPKISFQISKYTTIECKALAGYSIVSVPTTTFYNVKDTTVYNYPKGSGFGYTIGVGVKYVTLDGVVGLHLNVSYAGSLISFPNYTVYYTAGAVNSNNTYNTTKTMSLGIIQVSCGLSFNLLDADR